MISYIFLLSLPLYRAISLLCATIYAERIARSLRRNIGTEITLSPPVIARDPDRCRETAAIPKWDERHSLRQEIATLRSSESIWNRFARNDSYSVWSCLRATCPPSFAYDS